MAFNRVLCLQWSGEVGNLRVFPCHSGDIRAARSTSLTFKRWAQDMTVSLAHNLDLGGAQVVSTRGKSQNFAKLTMRGCNYQKTLEGQRGHDSEVWVGHSQRTCLGGNACRLPRNTSAWSQMTGIYPVPFLLLQPQPAHDAHHPWFGHLHPVIL